MASCLNTYCRGQLYHSLLRLTVLCIAAKTPVTVHLGGDQHIGYDLSQMGGGGQPLLADQEVLHLVFRTASHTGLLFYTGDH